MRNTLAALALVGLAGCAQVQGAIGKFGAAEPQIADACAGLDKLAAIAQFVPAAAPVVPWVTGTCHTADGLAKMAADPFAFQYLGQLEGKLKALTGRA